MRTTLKLQEFVKAKKRVADGEDVAAVCASLNLDPAVADKFFSTVVREEKKSLAEAVADGDIVVKKKPGRPAKEVVIPKHIFENE